MPSNADSSACAVCGARFHPSADLAEMRAFTSANGIFRSTALIRRLGHKSESTNNPTSGRQ
jgi:hypothetical protein